uniref:TetR family transcriptional regulator n=1 Tax=Thermosporothrix sp. COM3 TaxID=2490863 RepID=A0A455SJ91_9CHLR|nr:TetR family transcriptional regulator [Thermosporothrix sp. COM3]
MASTKRSTKRTDAVTNRARILKAALAIFAEHGLELEMSEVAAQAGLGVGTLYGHFANREDLLRAILQSAIEDALTQLRSAQQAHPDNPRAALEAFLSAGVRLQDQYKPLSGVLRDTRLMKLMDPSYVSQIRMQFLEMPRELFRLGAQKGVFRQDLDPNMVAVIIMGAFISAMDLLETYRSLDELVERLTHSLMAMLMTEPARPEA